MFNESQELIDCQVQRAALDRDLTIALVVLALLLLCCGGALVAVWMQKL